MAWDSFLSGGAQISEGYGGPVGRRRVHAIGKPPLPSGAASLLIFLLDRGFCLKE